jgi:hypothetical protein
MVGLPFIAIRPNTIDAVSYTYKAYLRGIAHWKNRATSSPHEEIRKNAQRYASFLDKDLQEFQRNLELSRRPSR